MSSHYGKGDSLPILYIRPALPPLKPATQKFLLCVGLNKSSLTTCCTALVILVEDPCKCWHQVEEHANEPDKIEKNNKKVRLRGVIYIHTQVCACKKVREGRGS